MVNHLAHRLKVLKKKVFSQFIYTINPQLLYGDDSFYTHTHNFKENSIRIAAELMYDTFGPQTVFDIGCGEGLFLNVLHQKGVQVLGCDISDAAIRLCPKDFFIFQADATKPLRFNRRFDLCICVEIAEHIPTSASKALVENVTRASDTVFFTAAVPGQGGVGHINEQPHSFWVNLFEKQGYQLEVALSERLRQKMKEENVVFWLWQNLMIFTRSRDTASSQ